MLPLKDNGANPIVDSLAVVGEWNIVAKWVVDESGFCWVRVFNGWEYWVVVDESVFIGQVGESF